MKRHIPLLAVLFGCTQLQAEIYKCTDASGDTQYSDKPCGGNTSVFVPRAAPAAAGDAAERAEKTQRLLQAYDAENAERQRKATAALAARKEAEQKCSRAQGRLRGVTQASAVYRFDKDGNRVVLSFEERAASEEKARAAVTQWCN